MFYIEPGNTSITKGESLLIKINVLGYKPEVISLFKKSSVESEYAEQEVYPDSNDTFIIRLNSMKNSTDYFAEAEGINSEKYNSYYPFSYFFYF